MTAVLGGPFKKTAILAPAIERQWLATLRQGVRGLPVDVETFWSVAVFFEEPGMMIFFTVLYDDIQDHSSSSMSNEVQDCARHI